VSKSRARRGLFFSISFGRSWKTLNNLYCATHTAQRTQDSTVQKNTGNRELGRGPNWGLEDLGQGPSSDFNPSCWKKERSEKKRERRRRRRERRRRGRKEGEIVVRDRGAQLVLTGFLQENNLLSYWCGRFFLGLSALCAFSCCCGLQTSLVLPPNNLETFLSKGNKFLL